MERILVKQLKKFKEIKPSQEWFLATKKEILSNQPKFVNEPFHWLLWQKSAVLAGSCLVVLLVFFTTIGVKNLAPLSEWTGQLLSISSSSNEALLVSLHNLENGFNQTALSLKNLDSKQILSLRENLDKTINQGEIFVAKSKQDKLANSSKETMSALSGIESALAMLKETNQSMQKRAAEREIAEMKNRILTDSQQKLLQEAEDALAGDDYSQALSKIAEIGK